MTAPSELRVDEGPLGHPGDSAMAARWAAVASWQRILLLAAFAVFLLSVTRIIADTGQLTSSGTSGAALRFTVPIALAALGGVFCERAGVINIGLEGMMILGTWFGAYGAWQYGIWWGLVFGMLGGAAGGLLHAVATVTFGVDHIISGVAINILGGGIARYLSVVTYTTGTGGGATQSPAITDQDFGRLDVPFLAGGDLFGWTSPDLFGWLEERNWFFLGDLGGILKGLTSNLSTFTIIAIALVPLAYLLLWHTAFGLRLRSCGENPEAAESLGVPVYRMKYAAVTISGALAGMGGAFLALVASNLYREGQTGGRGFIGLAAMIFGNWNPFGALAGASLFGFTDALQIRSNEAVHALLLFVALLTAVFALRAGLLQRRMLPAALLAATSVAFLAWYLFAEEVPRQFVTFTPHVVTLLVLGFATQRLRPPAWNGRVYRKGEAH